MFFSNSNLTTPGRAGVEFEVAQFDIESILDATEPIKINIKKYNLLVNKRPIN